MGNLGTRRVIANALKMSLAIVAIFSATMMAHSYWSSGGVLATMKLKRTRGDNQALYADIKSGMSKNLNRATITVAGISFDIPSISANTRSSDVRLGIIVRDDESTSCEKVASAIDEAKGSIGVTKCSAENRAQEKCQKEIEVRTSFDYVAIHAADARYIGELNYNTLKRGDYVPAAGTYIPIYAGDLSPANADAQATNV